LPVGVTSERYLWKSERDRDELCLSEQSFGAQAQRQ